MDDSPLILLKVLLKQRHIQGYRAFTKEYDKAAGKVDPELAGSGPSRAQYFRWLSGTMVGLPYPHHLRVLEQMFPDWQAGQLFEPYSESIGFVSKPATQTRPKPAVDQSDEIVRIYPTRASVPYAVWNELIHSATKRVDVLVFSGQFLVEQYDVLPVIRAKVRQGVKFRFLVGNEQSPAVVQRAVEEGTTGGLEGRIQMMRRYLRGIADLPGVDIRNHGTILYNSIYRFDDQALVNGHAYGALAGESPVLHLRRTDDGPMWRHYMDSYERVWQLADEEK